MNGADNNTNPAHAVNERALITRRLSPECDDFHVDRENAGCENGSCQCWCHLSED